jgi:hypothetical protein
MAEPKILEPGADSRRNWKTINEILRAQQDLAREVRRLQSTVTDLRAEPKFRQAGGGGSTCAKWA